jgi:hypothetical protein
LGEKWVGASVLAFVLILQIASTTYNSPRNEVFAEPNDLKKLVNDFVQTVNDLNDLSAVIDESVVIGFAKNSLSELKLQASTLTDSKLKSSLLGKLDSAIASNNQASQFALNAKEKQANNMLNTVGNVLNAFLNEIKAQKGKGLSNADADTMIQQTEFILDGISRRTVEVVPLVEQSDPSLTTGILSNFDSKIEQLNEIAELLKQNGVEIEIVIVHQSPIAFAIAIRIGSILLAEIAVTAVTISLGMMQQFITQSGLQFSSEQVVQMAITLDIIVADVVKKAFENLDFKACVGVLFDLTTLDQCKQVLKNKIVEYIEGKVLEQRLDAFLKLNEDDKEFLQNVIQQVVLPLIVPVTKIFPIEDNVVVCGLNCAVESNTTVPPHEPIFTYGLTGCQNTPYFLKFDISGATDFNGEGTLRLRVIQEGVVTYNPNFVNFRVVQVSNAWDEDTITFNTQPPEIGLAVVVGNPGITLEAPYDVLIPLTDITPQNGIFSLKVQDTLSATCDDWLIIATVDNLDSDKRPFFEIS